MVDFGAAKKRRARNSYLGHRVRGVGSSALRKEGEVSERSTSKVSKIKAGLDIQNRLRSLSKNEKRARFFNFNDDDDDEDVMIKGGADGSAISARSVTRKNILETLKDDFEESGLILSDDEEKDKQLNPLLTRELQFGAGGVKEDGTKRTKTRREKLQETILKNKTRKAEHAHNVYAQTSLLEEADEKINSVINSLDFKPTRASSSYKERLKEEALEAQLLDQRTRVERKRDDEFDSLMRSLAQTPKVHAGERKLTLAERKQEDKRRRLEQETRMKEDIRRAAAAEESDQSTDQSSDESEDGGDDSLEEGGDDSSEDGEDDSSDQSDPSDEE